VLTFALLLFHGVSCLNVRKIKVKRTVRNDRHSNQFPEGMTYSVQMWENFVIVNKHLTKEANKFKDLN